VHISVHGGKKQKTPPPVWQWGLEKSKQLEPDCHAAQQQRVRKQQVQIAIHGRNLAGPDAGVKWFPGVFLTPGAT
jgi:hypothetical protein